MDAPAGATLKPWGWQLCLHSDEFNECWLAFAHSGQTSIHHHAHHASYIQVMSGDVDVYHGEEDDTFSLSGYDFICVPQGVRHRLIFTSPAVFTEVYDKKTKDNCPPVTEDTIRE